MTTRLSQTIEAIGLATSGELGSRFAPRLGIVTSPTTILRRTMSLSAQGSEAVSQLGIDDWSFRRGRQFGTMLVNLATHEIVDLLPDRETETAQAWMQAHPEIDVVSRDRGEEYAAAARKGAPQARQVADRYHLTDNLRDFLEEILARCHTEIGQASMPPTSQMRAQETEMTWNKHQDRPSGLRRMLPWRGVLISLAMRSDWIAISTSSTCVQRGSHRKK